MVDPFLSHTAELADVVLPVASPLTRPHHDVVFNNLAVRNQARYSPAVLAVPEGEKDEAEVLLTLAAVAVGIATGTEPSVAQVEDFIAMTIAQQACSDQASRAYGREPAELLEAVAHRSGVDRLLDLRIRSGPYGDGFGTHPDGLTLQHLIDEPHGIDLGPLQPRLPEVLRTPSGRIEVAPQVLLDELITAQAVLSRQDQPAQFTLVGRRQLRSNNSWMKDLSILTGGSNAATALLNSEDAQRIGVNNGDHVRVSSAVGRITLPAVVTDDVSTGCVCIPHGWGEANVNELVDTANIDRLGGTSVLSGIAVEVRMA